jgi:exonuclease III
MLGYQKNRGLRIDHILVSEPVKPHGNEPAASTAFRGSGTSRAITRP